MSDKEVFIIANRIRTPDGTVLHSKHRWDCVSHVDSVTGERYMIDGGNDYLRGSINKVKAESMVVTSESSHEEIREVLTRGTYGKNGDEPYHEILLKDMTTEHIKAVIEWISEDKWVSEDNKYLPFYKQELIYREENNIE